MADGDIFDVLKEGLAERTLGWVMPVISMVVMSRIFTWPVRIVTRGINHLSGITVSTISFTPFTKKVN